MSSSSARGQTEPIAALLAVVIVAAGLALYAGVLDDALERQPNRDVAAATLERVDAHLTPDGVVEPSRLRSVQAVTPNGYETNVTLTVDGRRVSAGPSPGPNADRAVQAVSVRTAPATVEKGTLTVVTWR